MTKVEHVYSYDNDRWVFIAYNNSEIVGLNFEQGVTYAEFIDGDNCEDNPALTEYYGYMTKIFAREYIDTDRFEFINKILWSYHYAIVSNDLLTNKADLPWK
jgi:hypothetical protein